MDRESFLFYKSYYQMALQIKNKSQRCDFYESIINAALKGEPLRDTDDPVINMAYIAIRPLIEANIRNYENGCKGGAPKGTVNNPKGKNQYTDNRKQTENKPKDNRKQTDGKGNVNVKDNVKVNDKDNDNVNDNVNVNVNNKEPAAPSSDEPDNNWFENLEDETEEFFENYRKEKEGKVADGSV